MKGFKFNNRHSYNDFQLILEKKKILPPAKKKIKLDVPYMNGSYDFSTVATNGEVIFGERQIEVMIAIVARSREHLFILYSNILEWLMDTGWQQLIFDDMQDYYYMAEVENISDFQEVVILGELKVTFIAQPFKIAIDYEGNKLWDTFNFETDVLQDTEFDVIGSSTVNIINVGRPVTPVINVSTDIVILFNNKQYNLLTGDNKFYDFKLANGENSIIIVSGTGHIKFLFRKEML